MLLLLTTGLFVFLIGCYFYFGFLLEEIYRLSSEIDELKKEVKYLKKENKKPFL
jgi:hypothetical protein